MEAIKNNPVINSIANWAWSSDPSPDVSPQSCLESFPLLTTPCLSRLIARGIGIGIIAMSCINKAPVISNMLTSNSAAGLSVTASCGEVIMYSNAAFYNYLRGNPFTAYGETMSLVIQTLVIVGLIFWFRRGGADKIGMERMVLAVTGYLMYLSLVFRGKTILMLTKMS
jgi:hypothetical protein